MVLIVAQFRAAYKKEKTMKEPTMEEVLELVSFRRDADGKLQISNVYGGVKSVHGNIYGDVHGNVHGSVGDVGGNVLGDVGGNVLGDVGGDVLCDVKGDVLGKVLNSHD
jgi:outer membrane lipoprotein SlyB